MKLTSQTELMKNQKHADTMSPGVAFDVLQASNGDALFFSIGTDGVFYVTREVRDTGTGWTRLDLSSSLPEAINGASIQAKSFALSQNPATGLFDIALVVNVSGDDVLYMCNDRSDKASEWENPVPWMRIPFDAVDINPPRPLIIADVYLMNIPSPDSSERPKQNCFVDIIRNPTDPLQLLDRYYIKLDTITKWYRQRLAADFKANSISSCIGHRANDRVSGIYTYGMIENTRQLLYTPQFNYFRPKSPPNTARLTLPVGASAIASVPNQTGNTNLFLAADGGLYLFPPDTQYDMAQASLVVPAVTIGKYSLFAGVSSMVATCIGNKNVIWLKNAQGDLFYVSCAAGSELLPSAWSSPVPFCAGVQNFAFYLNSHDSNIVLFVHFSDQRMAEFTQDSASEWRKRNILLPTTKPDDFVEFNSFTTTLKITDNNNVGLPSASLSLTAEHPVSVYVNNIYYVLSPDSPIIATADANATVTVIQETDSLSGVIATAIVTDDETVHATIDPFATQTKKLDAIRSGNDLSLVRIQDANGKEKPLVSPEVSRQTLDQVAGSLTQLLSIKNDLHAKGDSAIVAKTMNKTSFVPQLKAISISGRVTVPLTEALDQSTKISPGNFFNFLRMAWDEAEQFLIKSAQELWHFMIKIKGEFFSTVIDTVSAVFEAAEAIFNSIKVFFEDLVAWLGSVFDWNNILRTHEILKYELKHRVTQYVDSIDTIQDSIPKIFSDLEGKLNAWASITDPGDSIGVQEQKSSSVLPGPNSPQADWALQHFKNGMSSAVVVGPASFHESSALDQVLEDLKELISEEKGQIETTIKQVKEQVVDQFSTLTPMQILKKLLGIAGDLILKSSSSIIVKVLDVVKRLTKGALDLLDAPLQIPILSTIYKKIVGSDMTLLDVVCLIGAIPVTITYKLVTGQSPFPDDSAIDTAMVTADDMRKARLESIARPLQARTMNSASEAITLAPFTVTSNEMSATEPPDRVRDTLVAVFDIVAAPGAALLCCLAVPKRAAERKADVAPTLVTENASTFIRAGYFLSYCMYVAPSYAAWQDADSWVTVTNDAMTGFGILKNLADSAILNAVWQDASPWVDTISGLVGLAPALGGIVVSQSLDYDWTLFGGSLASSLGAVLSPFIEEPDTFVFQEVLTLSYGVLGLVTGVLYIDGKEVRLV